MDLPPNASPVRPPVPSLPTGTSLFSPLNLFVAALILSAGLIVFVDLLIGIGVGLVLAIAIGTVFFLPKTNSPSPSADPLGEKKEIVAQLDILEKKLLKHEIDEKTFHDLRKQKEAKLIDLEARILLRENQKSDERQKSFSLIEDPKKRAELQKLDERRQYLAAEMSVAQRHYLKRQIDSQTYSELTASHQKELSELEARIDTQSKAGEAQAILSGLKKELATYEKAVPRADSKSKVMAQVLAEEHLADQITDKILSLYGNRKR